MHRDIIVFKSIIHIVKPHIYWDYLYQVATFIVVKKICPHYNEGKYDLFHCFKTASSKVETTVNNYFRAQSQTS